MRSTKPAVALLATLMFSSPVAMAADTTQDQDRDQVRLLDQDQDQLKDQDQDRDRLSQDEAERQMLKLRDRLHQEDGIPNKALKATDQEMARYLRRGGNAEQLRATVRTGWAAGCEGDCLQEMVRTQNWATAWGMNDQDASALVCDALRTRLQQRDRTGANWTDDELGNQVRTQAQQQLRTWEQTRDQQHLQERLQEQQRQQQRDMERMQQQQQKMGGQGSGRQGMND